MLYLWFYSLTDVYSWLNLFRYITFRAAFAAVTSLILMWVLTPLFIRLFQRMQCTEAIHCNHAGVYEKHKGKSITPTMGGVPMLVSLVITVFLWADMTNMYVQLSLGTVLWMGLLGFYDDYSKCILHKRGGISAKVKLLWQALYAGVVGYFIYQNDPLSHSVIIPFFKMVVIPLGILYFVLIFFVLVGSSNAVNLTDGLDGLAPGCLMVSAFAYAVMSYIAGHYGMSAYLNLPFIRMAGELTIVCTALMGVCLGFLWYNCHPAQIFMGDTGALSLGGLLGMVAIMVKQEILLVIVGGVFVVEALSVIIQVVYFRLTGGKRFFLVAPLHHHFEMKGLSESKIVVRFWIVAIICAVMSLCTLKIR